MAQIVTYMVLPNTPDAILLDRVATLLGHITLAKPSFRDFRDWLRGQNLWKKEETLAALQFMGVRGLDGRGNVWLAPFGQNLADAGTPDERSRRLFEHLIEANPILVKYVVEALDMDSGGRLHSTHELHRYLTSYAYPGKPIRLVDFQNWVRLFQAAQGVRVIGIRWGLDTLGKENLPRIRQLDVEEILEDDALEEEEAGATDVALSPAEPPAPAPAQAVVAAPVAPPPAPAARVVPPPEPPKPAARPAPFTPYPYDRPSVPAPLPPVTAPEAFGGEGEDEEPPDMPPEAPRPPMADSDLGPSAAPAVFAESRERSAVPAVPARPERTAMPVAAPVMRPERRIVAATITPQERLETVRQVKAWWASFAHKQTITARDLGVDPADFIKAPQTFLLRLMTAAVAIDHEAGSAPVADFLSCLDRVQAFSRLATGEARLEDILGEVGWFAGNPWFLRLSEHLVHTAHFRARLNADPTLGDVVAASSTSRDAVQTVFHKLFGGAFALPSFWIIREMHRLGLWDKPAFAATACVPSYRVRLSAFRLGLIESFYAESFDTLREVSQILSRFFGDDCGYDAPLEHLALGFGCQMRCPHVLACPLACREKTSF